MNPFDRIECALGDLSAERVDAIVNAANETLRGGGGVDGAIHRAAGPGLLAECIRLHPAGCPTGEVRVTSGHALPARFVLHAVGPVYRGGAHGEAVLLASCHRRALEVATELGLATIAFPAISCGAYGYPWSEAAPIALAATAESLRERPGIRRVRFVLASAEIRRTFEQARQRLGELK